MTTPLGRPEPALSPSCPLAGRAVFDVVLLEMGVLHYFVDLRELFGGEDRAC